MHTVRTQLDLFQFVIPLLAKHFTVYALDLPGFGWSDIRVDATPDEPTLRAKVKEFVATLRIERPTLVGESIGATLALSVTADLGTSVERAVAFNTYDYLPGLERANLLASVIVKSTRAPLIGPIFAALENRTIMAGIMRGGVYDPKVLPADLLDEFARVGKRPGYPKIARAVLKALPSFVAARRLYSRISVPVTLVWGDRDWSTLADRAAVERTVPSPRVITLDKTGHFSSVEKPKEFASIVIEAARH
jgi:pimeloyl-ACP methyl ester carboxylesterase